MAIRSGQVMTALATLFEGQAPFPATIQIDDKDLEGWLPVEGSDGLQHMAFLNTGPFEPTIDAGPDNEWEGELQVELIYRVTGADGAARRIQRNLAKGAVITLVQANRTLGLDPQVFAQLAQGALEDDEAIVDDAAPVSFANLPFTVLYVADSAAG